MSRATGLAAPSLGGTGVRIMPPAMPHVISQDALQDRLDGVALLADSLSEDSAIARARELFRLFERAFRAGPSGCVDPLTSFLQSATTARRLKFHYGRGCGRGLGNSVRSRPTPMSEMTTP